MGGLGLVLGGRTAGRGATRRHRRRVRVGVRRRRRHTSSLQTIPFQTKCPIEIPSKPNLNLNSSKKKPINKVRVHRNEKKNDTTKHSKLKKKTVVQQKVKLGTTRSSTSTASTGDGTDLRKVALVARVAVVADVDAASFLFGPRPRRVVRRVQHLCVGVETEKEPKINTNQSLLHQRCAHFGLGRYQSIIGNLGKVVIELDQEGHRETTCGKNNFSKKRK